MIPRTRFEVPTCSLAPHQDPPSRPETYKALHVDTGVGAEFYLT